MEQKNKALTYAAIALVVLAVAMVVFYYVQARTRVSENDLDTSIKAEKQEETVSEFVGLYAPSDGPLEAEQKRIGSFMVNRKEDGGFLGVANMDTVGADEAYQFNCVEVRIDDEGDFFLNCFHEKQGSISLNGQWQRNAEGAIEVSGKVVWSRNGQLMLDTPRVFRFTPGE
jgi:hypothetical protein